MPLLRRLILLVILPSLCLEARAWDARGHRIVNQLALAALPADFPAFAKTPAAAARIAFLAAEPDRWRNTTGLPLRHSNGPNHYLDMEYLAAAGLPLDKLTDLRYVFAAQLAAAEAAHPDRFPTVNPDKNKDHVRELIGFLPWQMIEDYEKLKSIFSYLKTYERYGTPSEIANARADAIDQMGVMGHYVGDGCQPLHTTRDANGWIEPANPNRYTTSRRFHARIDGGYIAKIRLAPADLVSQVRPARVLGLAPSPVPDRDPVFTDILAYLAATHAQVEPLYQLEKTGALDPDAPDFPRSPARLFIGRQLLSGGQMLAALWLTAYRDAGPDTYLSAQLLKRQGNANASDD